MRISLGVIAVIFAVMNIFGCTGEGNVDLLASVDGSIPVEDGATGAGDQPSPITVNSLEDLEHPPQGTVTLRSALAAAVPGQTIDFDASLDGGTIVLSIVGEAHTTLKGEVMGMRDEPSGPVSYLVGYLDRDYGSSALYAAKNVVIDASTLPGGITLAWVGIDSARVLAVYGDLTMTNVSVTGGRSETEDISTDTDDQPWTLARGGALAVWGNARLVDCRLYGNSCSGDFDPSRDRGAFGGGLYANSVDLTRCMISGNTVVGAGAAGGGVYTVGGAKSIDQVSGIEQSSITGNRISGLFAYGGGVYSDGGGIGNRKVLSLTNCTIAGNLVEPAPAPPSVLGMGYWRGGGVYMSNGYLRMLNCTVVENEVYGYPRTDALGKPNLAGGIAATIGNAHAVEEMVISHSIVTGNRVYELSPDDGSASPPYDHDIFTGSLLHFKSGGYNRFGVLDFSQILVPVGEPGWASLCRKHYPKVGDQGGVYAADVLDMTNGVTVDPSILSVGVGAGSPAVRHYAPLGNAVDQIPDSSYGVDDIYAEYSLRRLSTVDNFLEIVLARLDAHYGLTGFAADFTADFEAFLGSVDSDPDTPGDQRYTDPVGNPILTLADTEWFGPAETWPKEVPNYPYIHFWHRLDLALDAQAIEGMGSELMGDDVWSALFEEGPLEENGGIGMVVNSESRQMIPGDVDQTGTARPVSLRGDIGAIEIP